LSYLHVDSIFIITQFFSASLLASSGKSSTKGSVATIDFLGASPSWRARRLRDLKQKVLVSMTLLPLVMMMMMMRRTTMMTTMTMAKNGKDAGYVLSGRLNQNATHLCAKVDVS